MRTIVSDGTHDYHTSKVLVDPTTLTLTENADGLPVLAAIGGGGGAPALQIVTVAQGATLTPAQFVYPTLVLITGTANGTITLPPHLAGQGGWLLYTGGAGGATQVLDNGGTPVPNLFVMLSETWVTVFDDGTSYETLQPVDTPNVQEVTGFKAFAGGLAFNGPFASANEGIVDADYAMTVSDMGVATLGLTAPRIITLPPSTTVPTVGAVQTGRVTILDGDGTVTGANTVSVKGAGSDTINGSTSPVVALSAAWDSADFHLVTIGRWQYKP